MKMNLDAPAWSPETSYHAKSQRTRENTITRYTDLRRNFPFIPKLTFASSDPLRRPCTLTRTGKSAHAVQHSSNFLVKSQSGAASRRISAHCERKRWLSVPRMSLVRRLNLPCAELHDRHLLIGDERKFSRVWMLLPKEAQTSALSSAPQDWQAFAGCGVYCILRACQLVNCTRFSDIDTRNV